MERLKFTTIAHSTHRYLSPLSAEKAAWLIDRLSVRRDDRVLDIGCGRAALLLDIVAKTGARGVGVDINGAFLDTAQAEATARGVAECVELRRGPLAERVTADERFDAVICLGASQAIGALPEAMRWAHGALRDGGVALFGDGFWQHVPDAAYLAALGGAAESDFGSHADNARRARELGFNVLATSMASGDEWDDYEGRYCAAIERYVAANPDDTDSTAMAARIRTWHDAYLRFGRDTLGFGYYVLSK